MESMRLVVSRLADGRHIAMTAVAVVLLALLATRGGDSASAGTTPVQEPRPLTVTTDVEADTTATPPSTRGVAQVGSAEWALGLLDVLVVRDGTAPASQPYERDDYDGWVDADGDCQSARHEVLIQESAGPVEFVDDSQCKVATGRWIDPYTGEVVTAADQASIDHVVSLSEAHHSGAWAWSNGWKQAFSNDIDEPATLAVSIVGVNQAKGSSGPGDWLPESTEARCAYAIARVRVKTRWQLSVSRADRQALDRELNMCVQLELPTTRTSTPLDVNDFNDDPPLALPRPTPRITPDTCDPRYLNACIPMSADDLNCSDVAAEQFKVTGADPHNFDGDDDGVACEGE